MSAPSKPSGSAAHDYEERNIPLRLLSGWMLGLYLSLGAVIAFVFFVYGTPKPRPEAELVLTRPMNQPALQSNGVADLKAFLAKQNETLTTYGWVDRGQGIVRVPVERAMEMVLQRGLPARSGK